MGKFRYQMVTIYLSTKLQLLASAEAHAKYVSDLLTKLCYMYKAHAAKVSHP